MGWRWSIIYALRYACANGQTIDVEFGRDGQPAHKPFHRWHGKPCPPKERTIDLRVGDRIFVPPDWQVIEKIDVLREEWVEEVRGGEGFVVG